MSKPGPNDPLFRPIDEGYAILRRKGQFKQTKLYQRAGLLFAQLGPTTFVRLLNGRSTTDPNITWLELINLPVEFKAEYDLEQKELKR